MPLEVARDTSGEIPDTPLLIDKPCLFGHPNGLPSRQVHNETNRISTVYLKMTKEIGAPGETRTPTSVRKTDFESAASTNSATGARGGIIVGPRCGSMRSCSSTAHSGDKRAHER